ncbi:MAG: bifunctional diaminohydroxyphosphoribosylaminopyrimidine deaminase/5-amino-6-(5-phosphoribosylamino)uracil reductase RibD [Saprospiraceae bacterium]
MNHLAYLEYCTKLAKNGNSGASPNPLVGSIVVHNNQIISEAWHKLYGGLHAERIALNKLLVTNSDLIKDSCLYVSLEPCNHSGKTPPCTNIILESGIRKVVYGEYDPNPLMAGKSAEYLKSRGIEVIGPLFQPDQAKLLQSFSVNIQKSRPYIILKWAQSSDHFLGLRDQRTIISNSYSDLINHKWRSEVDGILIGRKTAEIDKPKLTTRNWYGRNPKIFVLSNSKAKNNETLPHEAKWLSSGLGLNQLLQKIYSEDQIGILMVEGGEKTLNQFINMGLWDEARVISNHVLKLKDGIPAPALSGKLVQNYTLGENGICILLREELLKS